MSSAGSATVGRRQPRDLRDRRGDGRLDPLAGIGQQPRRPRADAGAGQPRRHDGRRAEHARRARSAAPWQDAAKILDVIAGYDPKDELTVFSVGRKPSQPYASFATRTAPRRLRIGVIREYMRQDAVLEGRRGEHRPRRARDRRPAHARRDDRRSGRGRRAVHALHHALCARAVELGVRATVPATVSRRCVGRRSDRDAARTARDPSRVPPRLSLRTLNAEDSAPAGEGKYMINRYLRERGDANIKTNADLIAKARFYQRPQLPRSQAGARAGRARDDARHVGAAAGPLRAADDAAAVHAGAAARCARVADVHRAAAQADVTARAGASNGRPPIGWSLIGQQGFPAITVPAGFTTEVWDRVRDGRRHAPGRSGRRPHFRSASISSRGRSTSRCCSASRRRTRRRRSIANRQPTSVRVP